MTMGEAAPYYQYPSSVNTFTYALWDAGKLTGCVCDEGWSNYDCSVQACPYGDDPQTTGQVDEKQAINCICQSTCSGTFTLGFRGETTAAIAHNADATAVKAALEALDTLSVVTVALEGGSTVCDNDGSSALITFNTEHGDVPDLAVTSSLTSNGGTPAISIIKAGATASYGSTATVTGTKEWIECSGRGTCDRTTGLCICQLNFAASNGQGAVPDATLGRHDCGYTAGNSACPIESGTSLVCNGQGTCSGTYSCNCESGYTGIDCALKTCATGIAWFDDAIANDNAHAAGVECSNRVRFPALYYACDKLPRAGYLRFRGNARAGPRVADPFFCIWPPLLSLLADPPPPLLLTGYLR